MATKILDITLLQTGNLPISYEADEATLSSETVELLGPESIINEVNDVVASIDLSSTTTTITRTVELRPLDRRGNVIEGVSLNPASITVEVPIRQLVGYRNVFVKIVTTGTIAQGYHLTSLVVDPPSVTIYTSDPALAEEMPSFLDTAPINLSGAYEDFNINVELQLQDGIVVVGNPQVTVQVGIDAIQSSIQFVGVPVEIINLEVDLTVNISPDRVDLYISGPMNLLEELTADNIRVTLDLSDRSPGTYQLSPDVFLNDDELRLDSILPGTIEVVLWR
jgi:YbbR domain-containing protein